MSRPMVRIYEADGKFIDREMNDQEFAQWQKDSAEAEKRKAEIAQAAAKRQALLDRLGITEEEAQLLLK